VEGTEVKHCGEEWLTNRTGICECRPSIARGKARERDVNKALERRARRMITGEALSAMESFPLGAIWASDVALEGRETLN